MQCPPNQADFSVTQQAEPGTGREEGGEPFPRASLSRALQAAGLHESSEKIQREESKAEAAAPSPRTPAAGQPPGARACSVSS